MAAAIAGHHRGRLRRFITPPWDGLQLRRARANSGVSQSFANASRTATRRTGPPRQTALPTAIAGLLSSNARAAQAWAASRSVVRSGPTNSDRVIGRCSYAFGESRLRQHRFNEDRAEALASLARLDGVDAEMVLVRARRSLDRGPRRALELVRRRLTVCRRRRLGPASAVAYVVRRDPTTREAIEGRPPARRHRRYRSRRRPRAHSELPSAALRGTGCTERAPRE
jgi:hypothetical protein